MNKSYSFMFGWWWWTALIKYIGPQCHIGGSIWFSTRLFRFVLWYLFVYNKVDSWALSWRGKPGIWSDSGCVRDLKWLQQSILNQIKQSHGHETRLSPGLLVYLNWLLTKDNLMYMQLLHFKSTSKFDRIPAEIESDMFIVGALGFILGGSIWPAVWSH